MKLIDYWWIFLRGCSYLFLGISGFELLIMRNGGFIIPLALGLSLYAITEAMYIKYVILGKPNVDKSPFSDSKER